MDGIAMTRHASGLPSVALQFGPFAEAGMAVNHAQQLLSLGLHGLKPFQVAVAPSKKNGLLVMRF